LLFVQALDESVKTYSESGKGKVGRRHPAMQALRAGYGHRRGCGKPQEWLREVEVLDKVVETVLGRLARTTGLLDTIPSTIDQGRSSLATLTLFVEATSKLLAVPHNLLDAHLDPAQAEVEHLRHLLRQARPAFHARPNFERLHFACLDHNEVEHLCEAPGQAGSEQLTPGSLGDLAEAFALQFDRDWVTTLDRDYFTLATRGHAEQAPRDKLQFTRWLEDKLFKSFRVLDVKSKYALTEEELKPLARAFMMPLEALCATVGQDDKLLDHAGRVAIPASRFPKFICDMPLRGCTPHLFKIGLEWLLGLADYSCVVSLPTPTPPKPAPVPPSPQASAQQASGENRFAFAVARSRVGAVEPDTEALVPTRDVSEQCAEVAHHLGGGGKVKMVAVALDATLVSIDTERDYHGSARMLRTAVEPVFTVLIPALIKRGIRVAVVCYATQATTVQALVDGLFPLSGHNRVIVRAGGNNPERRPGESYTHGAAALKVYRGEDGKAVIIPGRVHKGGDHTQPNRKQWNIESALAMVNSQGVLVKPQGVLFIDSNKEDSHAVAAFGYRTACFEPANPAKVLQNMLKI